MTSTHAALPDSGQRTHFEIDAQLPDPHEKAALQGALGAPGPSNRYLTADHAADPDAHHTWPLTESDIPAAICRSVEMAAGLTIYDPSGALDLTASYQDVPGLTTGSFTPAVDEAALVLALIFFRCDQGTAPTNAGDQLRAAVDVNGADEARLCTTVAAGAAGGQWAVQVYRIALSANTATTIKVQAANQTGARGRVGGASQMAVWRLPR